MAFAAATAMIALLPVEAAFTASRGAVLRMPHHVRMMAPVAAAPDEKKVEMAKDELLECINDSETPAEMQECMEKNAAKTIFTLEERDDGWNDVRKVIDEAKKEREGAFNALTSNFKRDTDSIASSAAVRWTKVIAEEVKEAVTLSGPEYENVPKAEKPQAEAPKAGALQAISAALPKVVPKVEVPSVAPKAQPVLDEEPEREYATERQRQVARAVKKIASLIPEGQQVTVKAQRERPSPKPLDRSSTSTISFPLLLAAYLAIPAAVVFIAFGGDLLSLDSASSLLDVAADVAQ